MYGQLPPDSHPKTIYILHDLPFEQVKKKICEAGFAYPFVVKPDVGMKGILFTAFFIFVPAIVAYGQGGSDSILKGTVRASDGKQIAGADVFFSIMGIVKTDEKGPDTRHIWSPSLQQMHAGTAQRSRLHEHA